ncbi:MAG: hypothetical protein ACR2L2_12635 [Acidobacteriota bacterium]
MGDDGKGGIYALLVVVIILIIAAVLFFGGFVGGRGDTKKLEVEIGTKK